MATDLMVAKAGLPNRAILLFDPNQTKMLSNTGITMVNRGLPLAVPTFADEETKAPVEAVNFMTFRSSVP